MAQGKETARSRKSKNPLLQKDYHLKDNRLHIEGYGTVEKYPAGTTEVQIKEKTAVPDLVPVEALEALEALAIKNKKNPAYYFNLYFVEAITEDIQEELEA